MKFKINIFILFLFFNSATYSQTEWAPINAEWYYNYREGFSPETGYYYMQSVKDTVIDSKYCKVLSRKFINSKGVEFDEGISIIYQDTQENKIYRFLFGSFYLLYDFSKEKGDTLIIKEPYSESSYDSIVMVVDSVREEEVSTSNYLKTIHLKRLYTSNLALDFDGKIIEKVGNLGYFFPFNQLSCDSGCPLPLRCYNDNQVNFVSKEPYVLPVACDFTFTGSDVIVDMDIRLTPNPCNGIFSIETTRTKSLFVNIYSSSGQIIFQDKMIDETKRSFDISIHPSGIYYLKIYDKERSSIKKLIKY